MTAPTKPVAARSAILVTGVPRSGTTWLARLLATAPGTALTGREPMNPRGRQHALGHTLTGWARLEHPTRRQVRALRAAYTGRDPRVYGRYGQRQWRAFLPSTRLVVKDPFAMLSIPAVTGTTGARPVLLYRHPGAALVSYRRMGWQPDLAEVDAIVRQVRSRSCEIPGLEALPAGPLGDVRAMGWFWSALHLLALHDLTSVPDGVVVSHERLATHGPSSGMELFDRLGLCWTMAAAEVMAAEGGSGSDPTRLHNLERNPGRAAVEWKAKLPAAEVAEIEACTQVARTALEHRAAL